MNYFTTTILALVSFYVLLLIVVFFFQRNLLYHPSLDNYIKDQTVNEPSGIEKVKITTEDNIDLIAWFYNRNVEKFKTILFFHGNAGSLNNRTYKLNHFKDLNVNFLIIAWRGFSGNKGKPNELGLYEDAKSAVRWLNMKGIKDKDIGPLPDVWNFVRGVSNSKNPKAIHYTKGGPWFEEYKHCDYGEVWIDYLNSVPKNFIINNLMD